MLIVLKSSLAYNLGRCKSIITIVYILGQLRIHGDPRSGIGNIALRLKETDSPVDIPPGTRNLTLRRRLDKEGREGPSSVYVNVICDRLHTSDPVRICECSYFVL